MIIEKEIKVLNVDILKVQNKLSEIGAKFLYKTKQARYIYDTQTIYYRYLEICELLKSEKYLIKKVNLEKLNLLFTELEDLIPDEELEKIKSHFNISCLHDLLSKTDILNLVSETIFHDSVKNLLLNTNEWIRLREAEGKITLAVKRIIRKNKGKIQKVLEQEINVEELESTNQILNCLGFVRKIFQENYRYQYKYKTAEISIDLWPRLEPYIEIESEDEEIFNEIIDVLELKNNEIISCNTQVLYERIGLDILSIPELRFSEKEMKKIV